MRRAVTVAQKADGKWVVLALPDIPIKQQKLALKELKSNLGIVGKGKEKIEYKMAILVFTPGKQVKFKPDLDPRSSIVDDLTLMAEVELKKVIDTEKLSVKFDKDHDKVRAAIRKSRAQHIKDAEKIAAKAAKKEGKKGEEPKTDSPPATVPPTEPTAKTPEPEPSRTKSK